MTVERYKPTQRAVDEAAEIGAGCLVLVAGGLPPGSKDIAGAREQIRDGIAAMLPHARAANMPLALPLRSAGALDIKAFMFGAWKKPKPHPQMAMRQTISRTCGLAGSIASRIIPRLSKARPTPPRIPAGWRSDRRPAIGAMMATTSGQGVMKKPVSTCDRPRMSSR